MEVQSSPPAAPVTLKPGIISSYNNGWTQLWKHFLVLFLIFLVTIGFAVAGSVLGLIHILGIIVGIAYPIFFSNPLSYGSSFAYLKASRGENVEVQDIFSAFKNYWNAVGASILTGIIVVVGFIFVLVPGIFLACKPAFVPYLVVDKKMSVTQAISASWNMTKGHGWKVFLLYLLAIPIVIAGLICIGVGVIISFMWVSAALASLYHAVDMEKAAAPGSAVPPMTPVVG